MLKKLGIFLITILMSILCICPVYATNTNSLLNSNTLSPTNSMNNTLSNNYSASTISADLSSTRSTTQTSSSNLPESDLGLNNVLNILLIVIGIVLILLGIAVLIRLKK